MSKYLNPVKFALQLFNGVNIIKMLKNRGFTLVEMMTTALIFSLVAGMAIGLLISVIRVQRYNLVSQQLLDQISYTIEYMSRAIRMAQRDTVGSCITTDKNYEEKTIPDPETSVQGLMFRDYNNDCKGFFVEGGQLKEYEEDREPSEILELTSNKLEISALNFELVGESSSDDIQPRVTIFIEVKEKNSTSAQKIKVQTTISQRNVDMEGSGATVCSGTDVSCGASPPCEDCTIQNGCAVVGAIYEYYSCLGGTICALSSFDDCSDCTCSCGGYNVTESIANGNCSDEKDNDCDGLPDILDPDCIVLPAIPADYVSFWKFEGNANDEKGTNNGTINGNPVFVPGVQGQGLLFDGDGDYVNVGNNASLNVTNKFTVSVWTKFNSWNAGGNNQIVAKNRGNNDWELFQNWGSLSLRLYNSWALVTDASYSMTNILAGTWYHIVGTYDSTGDAKPRLYVNNVNVSTGSANPAYGAVANSLLYIGAEPSTPAGEFFNGTIDNVLIYNRALSAPEIQDIYNSQKP